MSETISEISEEAKKQGARHRLKTEHFVILWLSDYGDYICMDCMER